MIAPEKQITFDPTCPEALWILGRPCFEVAGFAQILRESGQPIDTKAEAEQAAVAGWSLDLLQKHGADRWRNEAQIALSEMIGKIKEQRLAAHGSEVGK